MDMNALKNYAGGINSAEVYLNRKLVAKVTGVTFEGRQSLLAAMDKDTKVSLERDRRNEYDQFAVKVMAVIGTEEVQVGFVPKLMAKKIAIHLDNGGANMVCSVSKLSGGGTDSRSGEALNRGLEIIICPEGV